ncbi:thioesterase [Lentzea tibetensis]|uniref:Thioesterase n=1 Tax=Lentzea tibetensis TaxID=2591470 RepID=A0A563ET85_9PSEU|nr:alpha/beta fold hydrolase [Lentzea tibetensis]TWP50748.1 thioesterase [Lentzea tibetensis]
MRLYCFPHAGATTSVYRPWQAPGVQVVGVDRPGRGLRAREPKVLDYPEVVASTAEYVAADLESAGRVPFATFGHSFGAMLSLAVAAEVERIAGTPPLCAVVSAALPPRLQPPVDDTAGMSDADLLDKIAADGGTAPELLSSPAMAGFLVGLMRDDYAVRRQFPRDIGLRVGFPLTMVAARDDAHLSPEQMWAWAEHTTGPVRRVEVPGGHFAAVRAPADMISIAFGGS